MGKSCLLLLLGLLAACGSGSGGGQDAGCRDDDTHTFSIGSRDDTFWVGPYIGHTTTTSVVISWETEQEGPSLVEYGPDESYGNRAEVAAGTMHEVEIGGLEPQTLYHYRACSGDTCTGDLTFSTAPRPGSRFRFAVYGDSRTDYDSHHQVAEAIAAAAPVLVVNVGDVVTDGSVREQFKTEHFDPSRRLGHYLPIYVAIGNHEMKEWEVPTFREYFAFPEDPDVPLTELSYTFTYGDAFFLVLDDTLDHVDFFFPVEGMTEDPPLWAWLKKQAASEAAQQARWRFAFMHYPPDAECYSEQDYGPPSSAVRNYVAPLLAEHGFHALFAGHVHDYEYMEIAGLPCIITGGGGAGLEDCDNCTRDVPEITRLECRHHFLSVDLGCDSATVRAVDADGTVFDEHTLSRE